MLEDEAEFARSVRIAAVSAFEQESFICWIANRWKFPIAP
jgi:hypothetical protein